MKDINHCILVKCYPLIFRWKAFSGVPLFHSFKERWVSFFSDNVLYWLPWLFRIMSYYKSIRIELILGKEGGASLILMSTLISVCHCQVMQFLVVQCWLVQILLWHGQIVRGNHCVLVISIFCWILALWFLHSLYYLLFNSPFLPARSINLTERCSAWQVLALIISSGRFFRSKVFWIIKVIGSSCLCLRSLKQLSILCDWL